MPAKRVSNRFLRKRWSFARANAAGELVLDGVPVTQLVKKFGTPLYVLVEREIRDRLRRMKAAFPYSKLRLQYASKVNSNLEILRICREEGFELDASSVGEIILALLADFEPHQITFTNLFKSDNDIAFAAQVGVAAITADSLEELKTMNSVGERMGKPLRIFARINPQIEIGSHSTKRHKYGIPMGRARDAIRQAIKFPFLELVGLHYHGGYTYNPKVYFRAAEKLLKLARFAHQAGNPIQFIDLGGGFPVAIGERKIFEPEEFGEDFVRFFAKTANELEIPLPTLIFEPGKFITQNSGVGLMKIVSRKQLPLDDVLVTDGSTYSFLPDALIYKERFDFIPATKLDRKPRERYVLAGCTCDSYDVLSKSEFLPRMRPGDLLAAMDCGAYSNVLANNFNNIKRAPMVMIRVDHSVKLIRRRDRYSEMFAPELDVLKVADPDELKRYYDLHRVNINKVWRGSRNDNGAKKA